MNFEALISLLRNECSAEEIDLRREEISEWIPECRIMFGYDQHHPHHPYDLWMHCLHTLTALPRDIDDDMLYLAALVHDIGKPACRKHFTAGNPGGMYHGHAQKSAEILQDTILPGLLRRGAVIDADSQKRAVFYAGHHDDHIGMDTEAVLASGMNFEPSVFCNLLELEIADSIAHAPVPLMCQRITACHEAIRIIKGRQSDF